MAQSIEHIQSSVQPINTIVSEQTLSQLSQTMLPCELWQKIAGRIKDDRDLCQFASACKFFKAAVDSSRKLLFRRQGIYHYAFGKTKWEKFIGDIGYEPSPPISLNLILYNSSVITQGGLYGINSTYGSNDQ